jgi:hypothetical protein
MNFTATLLIVAILAAVGNAFHAGSSKAAVSALRMSTPETVTPVVPEVVVPVVPVVPAFSAKTYPGKHYILPITFV